MSEFATTTHADGGSNERPGLRLIDADVHNYPNSSQELARRDAWPPSGNRPGTDPGFASEQLLDTW